ncbi:hypothetical protein SprV_0100120000 [Sparganum proliferum]
MLVTRAICDADGWTDHCLFISETRFRLQRRRRSQVLSEVIPGIRVDLQSLQRLLQIVFLASFSSSRSMSTRGDISLGESFKKSLVEHPHLVAAASQFQLLEHGVDVEDSSPLQEFPVRNPVMPSQSQYSAEAVELELVEIPGIA